jgi:catechol 2,3-dioxygenase-like lactoylglutathione lyase family enzyme
MSICPDIPWRKVAHIALIVRDMEKALENWSKILGISKPSSTIFGPDEKHPHYFMDKQTLGKVKILFINLDNISIELMEALPGDVTAWGEWIRYRGSGVHHISWITENKEAFDLCVNRIVNELKLGDIIQRGTFEGGEVVEIDTRENLGAIIELVYLAKK